jgi:hypothetical protein
MHHRENKNVAKIMKVLYFSFLFLTFSGKGFSQLVPIMYYTMPELHDMVLHEDRFYAAGSAIKSPTYVPLIICMNLKADTIWTKEFPELCHMGSFKKIYVHSDTIVAVGWGANENEWHNGYSFVTCILPDGEVISTGYFQNLRLTSLTGDQEYLWTTAYSNNRRFGGLALIKGNAELNKIAYRIYGNDTSDIEPFETNDGLFENKMMWACGSCPREHQNTFTVMQASDEMDSLHTNYLFTPYSGECQVICNDQNNRIWVAGKARLSNEIRGLGVACFDSGGELLYSECIEQGERVRDAFAIIAVSNGDVGIMTKKEGVASMHIFRDLKHYKSIELTEYLETLPEKIIEYSPGKMAILSQQLAGIAYSSSAIIFWNWPFYSK